MLIFTDPAQRRMAQRQIEHAWVEATSTSPNAANPTRTTRAWRRIPEFGSRILRVVFRRDGGDVLFIELVAGVNGPEPSRHGVEHALGPASC
jgi:hypothetical protein